MNATYSPFQKWLATTAAHMVSAAFDRFLDKEINITRGTRGRASTSQNHLRQVLVTEESRDVLFPKVLQKADSDFLGGSFARHSKIWPLDDIDVYIPLDGQNLFYCSGGLRLPYNVRSDWPGGFNPLLLGDRWTVGGNISSKKLVHGLATVLRRTYPTTTRIRRAGEAVSVKMASDLGFDVVPCFCLDPDVSSEQYFYLIPDGNDGWIHTNPRIDNEMSEYLQKNSEKTFRKAVKLVKWWNANRFNRRFGSYYIELSIMKGFFRRLQVSRVDSMSDAVRLAFRSLYEAVCAGDQRHWLASAPPIVLEGITFNELQWLGKTVNMCDAPYNLESVGLADNAVAAWRDIFGERLV